MENKALDTGLKPRYNSEHNAGFPAQGCILQFANYFELHRVTFMRRVIKPKVTFKILRRRFLFPSCSGKD